MLHFKKLDTEEWQEYEERKTSALKHIKGMAEFGVVLDNMAESASRMRAFIFSSSNPEECWSRMFAAREAFRSYAELRKPAGGERDPDEKVQSDLDSWEVQNQERYRHLVRARDRARSKARNHLGQPSVAGRDS